MMRPGMRRSTLLSLLGSLLFAYSGQGHIMDMYKRPLWKPAEKANLYEYEEYEYEYYDDELAIVSWAKKGAIVGGVGYGIHLLRFFAARNKLMRAKAAPVKTPKVSVAAVVEEEEEEEEEEEVASDEGAMEEGTYEMLSDEYEVVDADEVEEEEEEVEEVEEEEETYFEEEEEEAEEEEEE